MAKFQYCFPQTMLARWRDDPNEKYETHSSESLSGLYLDYAVAQLDKFSAKSFILNFGPDLSLQSVSIKTEQGSENWTPRKDRVQASKILGYEPSDEEMACVSQTYRALVMNQYPKGISLLTLEEPANR
ncbi:hypothetical protein [Pseudomonas sp. IAC-BECa141]|uniref:hypothetical protein n=1 Tax=Pseudomonas sp. IAC-BECa141 TaxID=2793103 RepID=UPI001D06E3F4|nr:hypothetical protein [Pseudomonas sp. IAC-BECa141]UDI95289.1 hypothetical protein I5961_12575 [Pseudomonas sp. IAC-BECa141]